MVFTISQEEIGSSSSMAAIVGGWFGSAIVEKLIVVGYSYLQDRIRRRKGMKEGLNRLRIMHPRVRAVVAASGRIHLRKQNPALDKWLQQLQDAIYEADDVLDELEYLQIRKLKQEEDDKSGKVSSTVFSLRQKIVKFGKRALKGDPTLKKLRKAVKTLDELFACVLEFQQLIEIAKQEERIRQIDFVKSRETGSLPKANMLGREREKEEVLWWLRKRGADENGGVMYSNVSLLCIVGIGGMGKTTLLQHVYKDDELNDFDLKIWVCASNKFDMKRLTADMLESITGGRPNLETLNALQEQLKTELLSKKILVAMDDVWEEEEDEIYKNKWENFLSPLDSCKEGSKVIVTTRMESVASLIAGVMNKEKEILKLEGLEKDKMQLLLNRHAFAGIKELDEYLKLQEIGMLIVEKLWGSPLAAKVVGGMLRSNMDERHWINILQNDVWNVEQVHIGIMSVLRLSYDHLPTNLKSCFAFCSMFEKDYHFDRERLVKMWMALGYLHEDESEGKSMEDIGRSYIDLMVHRSFFEVYKGSYVMHDMLHDLAQYVAGQKCFTLLGDELPCQIPDNVRYLKIRVSNLNMLEKLKEMKKLRALVIYISGEGFDDVFCQVLKELKCIRLLNIHAPFMKVLPDAFGELIHLRYLDISMTAIVRLPKSVCLLYHLQVLTYSDWFRNQLPCSSLLNEINKLTKLRHLHIPNDEASLVFRIGKLTALQELDRFYVKSEHGYKIEELKHMNELRKLSIRLIENVKDAVEASSARLIDKRNLTDLYLNWESDERQRDKVPCRSTFYGSEFDENVINHLQPHSNLKTLKIRAYMGAKSAVWMKTYLIHNLESIELNLCSGWETLPPLGKLPFLKKLSICNMPKVKSLAHEFHGEEDDVGGFLSLKYLFLEELEALDDWVGPATEARRWFPRLKELHVVKCPKLRKLPSLPSNLEQLRLSEVGLTSFPEINSINYCSLVDIQIYKCGSIISLPPAEVLGRFTKLRNIRLSHCKELVSVKGLKALPSLKKLDISSCPKLSYEEGELSANDFTLQLEELTMEDLSTLLPGPWRSISSLKILRIFSSSLCSFSFMEDQWFLKNSFSIQEFDFYNLKHLNSLPSCFQSLSSLKILHINTIPRLSALPELPPSIQELYLINLPSLELPPSSMLSLSSLKILRLESIPLIQSLTDLPISLEDLHLKNLSFLSSLPEHMNDLSFLRSLYVERLPLLQKLPNLLPPLLQNLQLTELASLRWLPSCFHELSSLRSLNLECLSQVSCLPDLPLSLRRLTIVDCHPELRERCKKETGLDWSKVGRIPFFHMLVTD